LESKPSVIATVINDTIYDQRMIRICTSLSQNHDVALWGRKKSNEAVPERVFSQRRFSFLINSGPFFYLIYNIRIFFALLFAKADIIHAVDLDTLPACFAVSKLRRKTLVYDAHEYFTEMPELVSRPNKRAVWLKIEEMILPRVKQGITVGKMIANEYETKYSIPFTVVKNSPILQELVSTESTEKYLLYQGALNKGRGLEALIGAMPYVDIVLKIAGSGDLDNELKELVKDLGLEDKVTFLGMLKPSELPPITAGAFAGINVSENLGLSYYYSLNNKFFDYIHAGLPAITNPFPEYQVLNSVHNCAVFANAESHDIAKAVNLLLDNALLYGKLKKNCLLARKELNWSAEEKKLLKLYANIV
jgi:glycosyltransferase involved in cell wall biosynthesis